MARTDRYCRRPFADAAPQPFASAEAAWLWYAACQMARLDGARSVAGLAAAVRPCDPDDLPRIVDRLFRARRLGRGHLIVLADYGRRLAPPDPWAGDPPEAARLWAEALERLSPALRAKGIVQ